MSFIKAEGGPRVAGDPDSKFTVRYYDEEGNLTLRSGGSRAWRCNNPGNLRKSPYSASKQRKAIGVAGYRDDLYPVYPDRKTGLDALTVMLRGSVYSPLSLREALKKYEPANLQYIEIVKQRTGLNPERTIRSLSEDEFKLFYQAIEFVEDWKVGDEDFIERWHISGVHKKRGIIYEYLVDKNGTLEWILKETAITLSEEKRLRAIVVHPKNASPYLRPEYEKKPFTLVT